MRPTPPLRLLLLTATVIAGLGGCAMPGFLSFAPQTRGNEVDADALKQLVPGTSTRADVTAVLGSPTARATFDDNTWIYIGETTKPVIAGTQSVRDQQVYVLGFDNGGVLRDIRHRTQADSQDVDVVARTTPSPGSSASFMQQLLGNVGKFSAGGGSSGAQGSATNPGNF